MDHRYYRLISNAACYLLIFCVVDFRPLVIGGLSKLIVSAVLAYLLAFVVVHAPNICKLVAACVKALPISLFPLVVDWRWIERLQATIIIPSEPRLPVLFQRPPPIFLL